MANALQLRRGTTSEHSTFTGLVGEVTVDTTKDTVVVHDGSQAGGYPLAKFSDLTIANVPNLQTNLDAKVDLAGDTMTGFLTLHADPTSALHAATKEYVDTIAAAGIHYHTPVRVEAPSNLNATYDNGTAGVGATLTNAGTLAAISIDGVALNLNDRVLVYQQTNAAHNGIYTVTTVGDGATAWVLTRATDADSYGTSDKNALGEGDAFFVKEGDTGAGELYVMNTTGTITFGTTNITFVVIAETAIYSAGTGITLTGTTFSIGQPVGTSDTVTFSTVNANVVGNLDGIVGGTTPAAGSFTTVSTTGNITVGGTVDGRDVAADGTKLDGIEAGATADQVITGGSGIGVSGSGDVTISHADTSAQASVSNTGNTLIQSVTLDDFGHVTGLTSATVVIPNPQDATITLSAGNGISGGGDFTTDQSVNETISFALASSFTVSGDITAANFIVSSDQSLKENVVPIESGLDKVKALQGVEFDWIADGRHQIGFIAQEVEKVIPDVVSTGEDGIKGVQYANLVAVLVEAVKELSDRIDELEGNK